MENVIYIGSTLKNGVKRYQIFVKRPDDLIARLKVAYPLIELLFVKVDKLASAQAEITKRGTARALAYEQSKEQREIPAQRVEQVLPPVKKEVKTN